MKCTRLWSLRVTYAFSLLLLIALCIILVQPVFADGSIKILPTDVQGCYDIEGYGVAMHGTGAGSVTVDPPGAIVGAFIEWVGVEDMTPEGDGTSTLLIDGTEVSGTLAEGDAGITTGPSKGPWYSWWANIGPADGAFGGPGVLNDANTTLNISGWTNDSSEKTNGATVTVIYDTGADDDPSTEDCSIQNTVQILSGADWYYHATPGEPFTDLLVFTFPTASIERALSVRLSHAGTQSTQTSCRGGSVWMLAGSGEAPTSTEFDILAIGTDGKGYGINNGVEIVDDPFTGPTLPCTPSINPVPDHPYEEGHQCSSGAATCPYRAIEITPPEGGDVGPEWGIIDIDALVPAGTTWVAFQLESEADEQGESGSWGVASLVIASAGPNAVTLSGTDVTSSTGNLLVGVLFAMLVAGVLALGITLTLQRWRGERS